jgi:hypothetical protein
MNCLIDKKIAQHFDVNTLYLSLDAIHKLPRPHEG